MVSIELIMVLFGHVIFFSAPASISCWPWLSLSASSTMGHKALLKNFRNSKILNKIFVFILTINLLILPEYLTETLPVYYYCISYIIYAMTHWYFTAISMNCERKAAFVTFVRCPRVKNMKWPLFTENLIRSYVWSLQLEGKQSPASGI